MALINGGPKLSEMKSNLSNNSRGTVPREFLREHVRKKTEKKILTRGLYKGKMVAC